MNSRLGLKDLVAMLGILALGMPSAVAGGGGTDYHVSLSVRDMDAKKALTIIAKQLGSDLVIDGVSGKVSFEVQNGRLSDVMDGFCEIYSCTWNFKEKPSRTLCVKTKGRDPK